ncbi:MAG: bifunctional oligoribonuclease/PAP phosphatase NrnA [Candidatus Auribacterota bacterium]|nr:bifunctional oligoribonuclease/PAP phosphatase NrnA [Candidatus Auribacterota bacterium]
MKIPPPVIELLRRYDSFLITSHLRPDGDAVGSMLALSGILRQMGKKIILQNESPIQDNIAFLPGAELIRPYEKLPFSPRAAIIVDAPSPARTGLVGRHLAGIDKVINIDHHISNSGYGDACWVEADSSSAGEMIYHLIPALGAELTRDIALCIYVAILTDMGKFQYMVTPQSGARVLALAGQLVATGLVPYEIYKKVYNIYSIAPLKLLGEALSTLEFRAEGQIAFMKVSRAMLDRAGGGFDITENLISYPRDIVSTRVALLFTELEDGIKVSFRSKEPAIIDVNEIASRFGGGGHPAAAGAELEGSLDEAASRVIGVVEGYLKSVPAALI